MVAVGLTIAGSDPSGGAGIQADLKTMHQHGVYGASVITLVTVQNTQRVGHVQVLEPWLVIEQLDAVLEDFTPAAAKTGALGSASVIAALAERAAQFRFPLVVDPVMISKHGAVLLRADAVSTLIRSLLPYALLVTPNIQEAEALAGVQITSEQTLESAAAAIAQMGPRHVLIKGGHREGQPVDTLWSNGQLVRYPAARIQTQNTHGTGCVLSAAITARLARGEQLPQAVAGAKRFISAAIQSSPGLGAGYGPTNMHAPAD